MHEYLIVSSCTQRDETASPNPGGEYRSATALTARCRFDTTDHDKRRLGEVSHRHTFKGLGVRHRTRSGNRAAAFPPIASQVPGNDRASRTAIHQPLPYPFPGRCVLISSTTRRRLIETDSVALRRRAETEQARCPDSRRASRSRSSREASLTLPRTGPTLRVRAQRTALLRPRIFSTLYASLSTPRMRCPRLAKQAAVTHPCITKPKNRYLFRCRRLHSAPSITVGFGGQSSLPNCPDAGT